VPFPRCNPNLRRFARDAVSSPVVNTARIDATLAQLTADEIAETHWFIEVCERFGTMRPAEADEWRRRIVARRAFLDLAVDSGSGS
jgi:hypothetical protein